MNDVKTPGSRLELLKQRKQDMLNNLEDLVLRKASGKDGITESMIEEQTRFINSAEAEIRKEMGKPENLVSSWMVGGSRENSSDVLHSAIKNLISGNPIEGDAADWDQRGRDEASRRGVSLRTGQRSLVIPSNVLNTVTTDTGTGGGGNTIATNLEGYIPALRDATVLGQLGATFLPNLTGNIEYSAELATASAEWLAETGSITKSTPTFETRPLSPKRLGVMVEVSNKWLNQTSENFVAYLRQQILNAAAEKVDHAGLWGGEANGPTGIGMDANVTTLYAGDAADNSANADGAALIRADLINMMKTLATQNAMRGRVGFATNAAVRAALQEQPIIAGSDFFVWDANQQNTLMGYPAGITELIPSNLAKGAASDLSAIILGNFEDVVIGMWGGLELLVDPYTKADSGITRMIVNHYTDVLVRRPESFVAIKDVIA